jgi:5-methylcytosine-specific restriction endonuclease McrA
MPFKAPRLCQCGKVVPAGARCECQAVADRARKARHDARRPSARARGYDAEWREARAAFLTVNRTCRRCGSPATVVHHIQPHKGNKALFWNRANWFPACKPCHDGPLQAAERRSVNP